jgi:DNA-binding response OmpR family regulator
MRVLIVEDDIDTASEEARALAGEGIEAITVHTGRAALDHYAGVDVVLLDLRLPDFDGFELCRRIRTDSAVPIIIVSGCSSEFDRVLGLRLGADDYVVKPCGLRELIARVQAVARRWNFSRSEAAAAPARELRTTGPVEVDLIQRQVTVHGRRVILTRKEFDLLVFLSAHPGRVFSREEIMREVWGYDGAGDTRTLGVHMTALRKKLAVPDFIETVRGVGFRVVPLAVRTALPEAALDIVPVVVSPASGGAPAPPLLAGEPIDAPHRD